MAMLEKEKGNIQSKAVAIRETEKRSNLEGFNVIKVHWVTSRIKINQVRADAIRPYLNF
jgi:hypothetical protein